MIKSVKVKLAPVKEQEIAENISEINKVRLQFNRYLIDNKIDLREYDDVKGGEAEKRRATAYRLIKQAVDVKPYSLLILSLIADEVWYQYQTKVEKINDQIAKLNADIFKLKGFKALRPNYDGSKPEDRELARLWTRHERSKGKQGHFFDFYISIREDQLLKKKQELIEPVSFNKFSFNFVHNSSFAYSDSKDKQPTNANERSIRLRSIWANKASSRQEYINGKPIWLNFNFVDDTYSRGFFKKYKRGNPNLYYRNGYFLGVPFDMGVEQKYQSKLRNPISIGMDIGEVDFVITSMGKCYKTVFVDNAYQKVSREISRTQKRYKLEKRESLKKKLKRLRTKRSLIIDAKIRQTVSRVFKDIRAEFSREDLVVVIEKLKGMRAGLASLQDKQRNKSSIRMPYGKLIDFIKHKAAEYEICIVERSPYKSSQFDSRGVEGGKREGKIFTNGVFIIDADLNAANNMARKFNKKGDFTLAFAPKLGDNSYRLIIPSERKEDKAYMELLPKF